MKQRIVCLKMSFFASCVYLRGNLRVRLTTQRKSLRKCNLRLLAGPFDQGLKVIQSNLGNKFSFRDAYFLLNLQARARPKSDVGWSLGSIVLHSAIKHCGIVCVGMHRSKLQGAFSFSDDSQNVS